MTLWEPWCCILRSWTFLKLQRFSNVLTFKNLIVNGWQPFTVFAKSSIVHIGLGSECACFYRNFFKAFFFFHILVREISSTSMLSVDLLSVFLKIRHDRSSRSEVFCKRGVLKNFSKFTGKHLCQGLFFNRLKPATLLKKRLWHRCFIMNFAEFSKASFIYRIPLVAASVRRNTDVTKTYFKPFQVNLRIFSNNLIYYETFLSSYYWFSKKES